MQAEPVVTPFVAAAAAAPQTEGRVERADVPTVSAGKRVKIAIALAALLIAPAVGSLVRWKGLPPNFVFPPVQGLPKAPFSLPVFVALGLVAVAATVLVAVPRLFGFARSVDAAPVVAPTSGRLAPWFWPSLVLMVAGWALMWTQPASLAGVARCAFTPQWWGFILVLDAIVYARTGGRSLAAKRPRTLLALAIVSCGAWYLYEYLNLFLLETWYYPIREPWKHSTYVVAYTLAYSTVTPAVIEWYLLLKTFRGFAGRFERGPALPSKRAFSWLAIAAGLGLTAVSTIWPNQLFFVIWFGPDLVIAGTLALLGIWSPLAPLARGDWSRVILPAVAAMINGVVWEAWNYFSSPLNPHFWKYDVPYVDRAHIFEMPVLGFFGYAPFGVSVWLTWVAFAALLGLRRPIELDGDAGVEREA